MSIITEKRSDLSVVPSDVRKLKTEDKSLEPQPSEPRSSGLFVSLICHSHTPLTHLIAICTNQNLTDTF